MENSNEEYIAIGEGQYYVSEKPEDVVFQNVTECVCNVIIAKNKTNGSEKYIYYHHEYHDNTDSIQKMLEKELYGYEISKVEMFGGSLTIDSSLIINTGNKLVAQNRNVANFALEAKISPLGLLTEEESKEFEKTAISKLIQNMKKYDLNIDKKDIAGYCNAMEMKNILSELGFKGNVQNRYKADTKNVYYCKSGEVLIDVDQKSFQILENKIPRNETDRKTSTWKKHTSYNVVQIPSRNQDIEGKKKIEPLEMNPKKNIEYKSNIEL